MRKLALILFSAWLAAVALPQKPVDDLMASEMAAQNIKGLSMAIVHKGRTIFAKGYGIADLDTKATIGPDTPFPIASLSKPFLAMAVLKLAEDGKINLLDPIGRYVPGLPEMWQSLPIANLLNHTTGIPDFRSSPLLLKYPSQPASDEQIIASIADRQLEFPLNTAFKYSNTNYLLLGMMFKKAAGVPYAQYLDTFIFKRLGMKNTYVLGDTPPAGLPTGYVGADKKVPMFLGCWANAGGAIVSSVNDLAKWDASLYTERLLRLPTLKLLSTPGTLLNQQKVPYAMGWAEASTRGKRMLEHSGRIDGFRSFFARYVDYDLTVIILANHMDAKLEPLARKIAGMLVPELALRNTTPIQDTLPDVTAFHKTFIEGVHAGTCQAADLTEDMAKAFLGAKLAQTSNDLKARGALKALDLVHREYTPNGLLLSRYRLQQKDFEWLVTIFTDSKGLISGLSIEIP